MVRDKKITMVDSTVDNMTTIMDIKGGSSTCYETHGWKFPQILTKQSR
jgi:hypothetical protein